MEGCMLVSRLVLRSVAMQSRRRRHSMRWRSDAPALIVAQTPSSHVGGPRVPTQACPCPLVRWCAPRPRRLWHCPWYLHARPCTATLRALPCMSTLAGALHDALRAGCVDLHTEGTVRQGVVRSLDASSRRAEYMCSHSRPSHWRSFVRSRRRKF